MSPQQKIRALVCNVNIVFGNLKSENSQDFCPATLAKHYVHEFGLRSHLAMTRELQKEGPATILWNSVDSYYSSAGVSVPELSRINSGSETPASGALVCTMYILVLWYVEEWARVEDILSVHHSQPLHALSALWPLPHFLGSHKNFNWSVAWKLRYLFLKLMRVVSLIT